MKYFLLALLFIPLIAFAEQKEGIAPIQAPETVAELKGFGEKVLWAIPNAIANIWKEEVTPFWNKIFSWSQNTWNTTIGWRIENFIQTIKTYLEGKIEKRIPAIKEEATRKTQEASEEIQNESRKFSQSLWERFKDLFKEEEKTQ